MKSAATAPNSNNKKEPDRTSPPPSASHEAFIAFGERSNFLGFEVCDFNNCTFNFPICTKAKKPLASICFEASPLCRQIISLTRREGQLCVSSVYLLAAEQSGAEQSSSGGAQQEREAKGRKPLLLLFIIGVRSRRLHTPASGCR